MKIDEMTSEKRKMLRIVEKAEQIIKIVEDHHLCDEYGDGYIAEFKLSGLKEEFQALHCKLALDVQKENSLSSVEMGK